MVLDTSKLLPSLSEIRSFTQSTFRQYPCLCQTKAVEAVLKRDQDDIMIAGTGIGKTLTFLDAAITAPLVWKSWTSKLFRRDGAEQKNVMNSDILTFQASNVATRVWNLFDPIEGVQVI